MPQSRQCPTRVDGADPLIAHSISIPSCAKRQREHYHKCYTCKHALEGVALPPRKPVVIPDMPARISSEGAA